MTRSRHSLIRWPLVLLVVGLAMLVSASFGDDDGSGNTGAVPPSVFIRSPEDRSMMRSSSFEITGGLGGSVTTIEVFMDGTSLGPARRGAEPDEWRLPASSVSIVPGLHRISVTAVGEAGRDSAGSWIFMDPALPFEIVVEPSEATYEPGELDRDPDLLLLGDDVPLDLTVIAPPGISASTNARLTTGSLAKLSVNVRTETPGVYPITVVAVGPDGTERTATHTITITGDAPPAASGDPARVLFDDFEGPDLWTSTLTLTTNGSEATAELAGGGNPGGQRRMTHVMPGADDGENNPTQISVLHVFNGGGWDPGQDGPLSHIDFSEDAIEFEPPFGGAAIGAVFVVIQGGSTFIAPIYEDNAFTDTTWRTTRIEDLAPGDFLPAPGPDFSASGAPMTFGYNRSNTYRSGTLATLQHGIDNWTVELFGA